MTKIVRYSPETLPRMTDDWLKRQGKGYQSRMGAILRREMLASLKTTTK